MSAALQQQRCAGKRTSSVASALAAPGRPLERDARRTMESRFGVDFSRVRVHTDDEAAASAGDIHAAAYTSGSHVVFGAGRFEPRTGDGQRLLAHELAHVVEGGPEVRRQPLEEPPQDESRMVIDAVPDMLMTDVPAPRRIGVTVSDAQVTSIGWELVEPDGTIKATIRTRRGAPDAKTRPYVLESADFGDTGKFTLRCTGYDAKDKPVVRAVRGFNVLRSDLATGVRRFGSFGSLEFSKYAPIQGTSNMPPSADVQLEFYPASSVKCGQVMFVQAVQVLNETGQKMHRWVSRELGARASGTGWAIDKLDEGATSPFYSMLPDVQGRVVPQEKQGQTGHGGPFGSKASLLDNPSPGFSSTTRFESCAVCRDSNPRQVYGCATWGFTIDGLRITMMPRGFNDEPSDDFRSAASSWNAAVGRKKAEAQP
jgi:hypothetical protein